MIEKVLSLILISAVLLYFRKWPWNKVSDNLGGWFLNDLLLRFAWRYFHPLIIASIVWGVLGFWRVVDVLDVAAPARLFAILTEIQSPRLLWVFIGIVCIAISYVGLEMMGRRIALERVKKSKGVQAYAALLFESFIVIVISLFSIFGVSCFFFPQ